MIMKISDRVTRLETIIPEIHQRMGNLDAKMEGLDHVIRGNGAPGLAAKVAELTSTQRRWRDALFTVVGGIVVGVSLSMFNQWSVRHAHKNLPQMQQEP